MRVCPLRQLIKLQRRPADGPVLSAPEDEVPETRLGRYSRSIGEQVGASVLPGGALMGRFARAGITPGQQAAGTLLSATGAGTATEAAKERGAGALGQAMAGIAGGFATPLAASMALRAGNVGTQAAKYASEASASAANPREYALQKMAEKGEKAGVAWEAARDLVSPKPSPQLINRFNAIRQAQGAQLTPKQIAAQNMEWTADIVSRALGGEELGTIASEYGLHPGTVTRYMERYQAANPTPINMVDIARQQVNEGGAQPVIRFARAAEGIADSPVGAQRLVARQLEQPGRAVAMIQDATSEAELARRLQGVTGQAQRNAVKAQFRQDRAQGRELDAAQEQISGRVRDEAERNYQRLHALPPIVVDENLAKILNQPYARAEWNEGAALAEASGAGPVPNFEEMTKTYGLKQKPGLGLTKKEGNLQPPEQYESMQNLPAGVVPGTEIPVKALDYFQRALREDAKQGGAKGFALNQIRQRVIEALDPQVLSAGHQPLVPGFRQTMTAYRTGQADLDALQAGETFAVKNLGSKSRETLREFDNMTDSQKHLFRLGAARAMMDEVSKPGADVVAKFLGPGARQQIKRVFPKEQAERMIKAFEWENAASRTNKDILAGSRTAPMTSDMEKMMSVPRAAADVWTGRWGRLLENLSNRIAYSIGEQQARHIQDIATQSSPSEFLSNLNYMAKHAGSVAERDIYAQALRAAIAPDIPGTFAPAITAMNPPPPPGYPHARQANDGAWYIPDPGRPGKYLRVRPMPGSSKGALQVVGQTP